MNTYEKTSISHKAEMRHGWIASPQARNDGQNFEAVIGEQARQHTTNRESSRVPGQFAAHAPRPHHLTPQRAHRQPASRQAPVVDIEGSEKIGVASATNPGHRCKQAHATRLSDRMACSSSAPPRPAPIKEEGEEIGPALIRHTTACERFLLTSVSEKEYVASRT